VESECCIRKDAARTITPAPQRVFCGNSTKRKTMTCKKCKRKVRGRPAPSGLCKQCRK